MIYDRMNELHRYKGIHANIDTAIAYIMDHDLQHLSIGRHEIDGENVFVNVVETETKAYEEGTYEFHKRYIDLHIDLTGEEQVWVSLEEPEPIGIYDEVTDGGLCTTKKAISVTLGSDFVMCFPMEPHLPLIIIEQKQEIKKCIFKILFEEEKAY